MTEYNLGQVVGEKGPKGDTGAQGPQGPKGDTGAMFGVHTVQWNRGTTTISDLKIKQI